MMFKVGDKVRIINKTIETRHNGKIGIISKVDFDDPVIPYRVVYGVNEEDFAWCAPNHIELATESPAEANKYTDEMEQFNSGATRTASENKLSYVKALSPMVLRRYVQYLGKHRKQADGSMREFDNWKQGIPLDRYLDGLGRHFVTLWLLVDGFEIYDDAGQENIEDVLCAIIFNAMGMLHEQLLPVPEPIEVEEDAANN